jgi:hypothetical protein
MLDGYSDRMLRAPRFVREGNRLIPAEALVRCKPPVTDQADPRDEDPR